MARVQIDGAFVPAHPTGLLVGIVEVLGEKGIVDSLHELDNITVLVTLRVAESQVIFANPPDD